MNNEDFVYGYVFNLVVFWAYTLFVAVATRATLYGCASLMLLASILLCINLRMNRKNNIVIFTGLWLVYIVGAALVMYLYQRHFIGNWIHLHIAQGNALLSWAIDSLFWLSLLAFIMLSGKQAYNVAIKDNCSKATWLSTILISSAVNISLQFLLMIYSMIRYY